MLKSKLMRANSAKGNTIEGGVLTVIGHNRTDARNYKNKHNVMMTHG